MTACANWPSCCFPYGHVGPCEKRAPVSAGQAAHKFDSLFWVYDAGFRWGPPDLVYPDGRAPGDGKLGVHKVDLSATFAALKRYDKPTCEIPGCYVCKRDRDGNLCRMFP